MKMKIVDLVARSLKIGRYLGQVPFVPSLPCLSFVSVRYVVLWCRRLRPRGGQEACEGQE